MMIAQPEEATPEQLESARAEAGRRRKLAALERLRLTNFDEGLCGQILHVGPYSTETATIETLHQFLQAQGYVFDGRRQRHHEIYLTDPRRSPPDRWRTIVRQPITATTTV